MQQRKDEILAKKAKLAELKRQRELRQKEFSQNRQSIEGSEVLAPTPSRSDSRAELDSFISRLVDRPSSAAFKDGIESPRGRESRPNSVLSASQLSGENIESATPPSRPVLLSIATQTTPFPFDLSTPEPVPTPKPEIVTYSKGVQTDSWTEPRSQSTDSQSDVEGAGSPTTSRASKRLSRRQQRERDEEIRERLRKEIEEEIQSTRKAAEDNVAQQSAGMRYPLRTLTNDELNAVTSSNDFLDFVEKSSKVIERALDEEYDVLTDYALGGVGATDGGENEYGGSKRRGIEELVQFYDERWSKKRAISDINFSPKFPELVLASYTNNVTAPHDPNGIVQVWNLHLHSRPEYVFHSMSDILTAKFSPFHPNLIVGGSYSGQVLLWDTRSSRAGGGAPVQKTPLTGSGHTHPVYNISIVGTQNAHNIITASTDGVVCAWTVDMLSQPQEYLELTTPPPSKTEDLAPTTMTFPQSDPTFFLVGTEEGAIYPCHRYDRAGAKAGTDHRLSYRGHAAPVMSTAFHPACGAVDLGDLMLSSSLDWSVKLWRVRPPAVTNTSGTSATTPAQVVSPVLDLNREDVVYDARWSPHRPGVFAVVDGAGFVEVWDLCTDTEVYAAREAPTKARNAVIEQSLNKVAWEERDGRRLATGGLDGVLTVFEVGKDLSGGPDDVPVEQWSGMKRLVGRLEQGRD
ncbi:cytoplasmic dynein 1 intermediate chain 2 [Paracoccidioides lutzii Pb01]|uniref:Cytoplasmic dynein 1 intermediate chain 2 n=1 Tax=Paracoccidioides lutzii (strain ATCC MYA-826 / Pb01) TaxID=502779 RepID=C1H293_PARBA|nr:cytoplasmic dynein 1 intermediate chain 2 [Paracoccidioides lutzii Pb01]EEH33673.1 cytoplasmic dynein 1 intermediate chain 2 [Paracoccidioides lutzii Pb01]